MSPRQAQFQRQLQLQYQRQQLLQMSPHLASPHQMSPHQASPPQMAAHPHMSGLPVSHQHHIQGLFFDLPPPPAFTPKHSPASTQQTPPQPNSAQFSGQLSLLLVFNLPAVPMGPRTADLNTPADGSFSFNLSAAYTDDLTAGVDDLLTGDSLLQFLPGLLATPIGEEDILVFLPPTAPSGSHSGLLPGLLSTVGNLLLRIGHSNDPLDLDVNASDAFLEFIRLDGTPALDTALPHLGSQQGLTRTPPARTRPLQTTPKTLGLLLPAVGDSKRRTKPLTALHLGSKPNRIRKSQSVNNLHSHSKLGPVMATVLLLRSKAHQNLLFDECLLTLDFSLLMTPQLFSHYQHALPADMAPPTTPGQKINFVVDGGGVRALPTARRTALGPVYPPPQLPVPQARAKKDKKQPAVRNMKDGMVEFQVKLDK